MRIAEHIVLSREERAILKTWEHGRSLPQRLVQRARIIRLAADGMRNQDVARVVRVSCPTVHLWRQRFLALRLPGLEKDAPRPGRLPRIPARKIRAVVEATLHTTPPGATHWSTRTTTKARFKRWTEPSLCCRCGLGFPLARHTITSATAPRPCSPRSACWMARSLAIACRGIAIRNLSAS